MRLLEEWYAQETKDSEEEIFHRPLSDEQLFFMLSVPEILILFVKTANNRNSPKQKVLAFFLTTR